MAMRAWVEKETRMLDTSVDAGPRALLIVAALLLLSVYLFPLWTMTMFAPQYPQGLRLAIYSYKLDGGNDGQDIKEINVLNHYIGMASLSTESFTEFKWIPFVVGALGLLFLRAAVHGRVAGVLDVTVMFLYFGAFSLWSFGYKLYVYGHHLDRSAPVQVPGFMPPIFGARKIANFEVYSYPGPASYVMGIVLVLLLVAMYLSWRQSRAAESRR
jgi:copper chaperone NosL